MDSAVKSGAIVSALFPEAVRDRMYSEKPGKVHPKANDIRKFQRPDDPALVDLHPQSEDPVADLYPECTVLFADVVGFTAWAAEKSPVEVFKFLETIYAGPHSRIRANGSVARPRRSLDTGSASVRT
jgi:hypothetical protein